MNSFELSRKWFNFCFDNPEKICPNHTALYFFAIEHCNRLGKEKFGLPTEMAKEAIGIKSWHTYIKAFNDLVEWGFFHLIQRSKNQYSSNIIALIKNDKAQDKAPAKHVSKQQQSTYQSKDSIKELNIDIDIIKNNNINNYIDFEIFWNAYDKKVGNKETLRSKWDMLSDCEREAAMKYIPLYIQAQPDKKFRKNPENFLDNHSWNDEIIDCSANLSIPNIM
jgi:hypothetical protein